MKYQIVASLIFLLLVVGASGGASAEHEFHSAQLAPLQAPVGTAFTYQGFLKDEGSAANGSYSLRFSLWDDSSSGSQVGGDVTKTSTPISDGLFTVELDFGDQFDGTAYWLEIEVQGPGDPGYTPLSPRQPLNPVPYAIHTDKLDGYDAGVQTRYLSIPAAAFKSTQYDGDWDNLGNIITVWNTSMTPFIVAPVYLPHGAQVEKVTFFWDDTKNPDNGSMTLRRVTMADASSDDMASVSTSGIGGNGSNFDDSVNFSSIDNTQYSYYIRGWLPDEEIKLVSVLIEYTEVGLQ